MATCNNAWNRVLTASVSLSRSVAPPAIYIHEASNLTGQLRNDLRHGAKHHGFVAPELVL